MVSWRGSHVGKGEVNTKKRRASILGDPRKGWQNQRNSGGKWSNRQHEKGHAVAFDTEPCYAGTLGSSERYDQTQQHKNVPLGDIWLQRRVCTNTDRTSARSGDRLGGAGDGALVV